MKKYILVIYLVFLFNHTKVFAQYGGKINGSRIELLKSLIHTKGTYAFPPKKQSGEIDFKKLIRQLKDIHANTYNWLNWGNVSDLNALKKFLPLAKKAGINVWITLVPPSESPPFATDFSEPFQLDYQKWAIELAILSLEYKNLVAWSIDDFVHNLQLFTPAYVKQYLDTSRIINQKFAFVPCCYFKQITPAFVKNYGDILDGILFPYRNESISANLKDAGQAALEIKILRTMFPARFLIFLDVYASAHSSLGSSTPEYVKQVISQGMENADGVLIYCHQDPDKSHVKYEIIKEKFNTK